MNVIFDHNVPRGLARLLPGHSVEIAKDLGWAELQNGALLNAAEQSGFQAMITSDKNMAYQQNLTWRRISLIVLATNNWNVLQNDGSRVLAAVDRAVPGSFERL